MVDTEQFQILQRLCNDILQNISVNNIEIAKRKSWLLNEVINTQLGKNYEEEK